MSAGKRYGEMVDVDIESIVRGQDIVYEDAADCWQDGHILGNGDLGAVCYAPYWLEWTVNKIDVFDGRKAPRNMLTHREVMNAVEKRKATNLRFLGELEKPDKDYEGPGQPALKSCGQVKIRTTAGEFSWGGPPPY